MSAFETIECPDRETWLAERKKGIGASEAAAVLGASPWKTIVDLWGEKTGLIEPSQDETEAMKWGLRLEDAIADAYAEETGRLVLRPKGYVLSRSTTHPFMQMTHDAEVVPIDDRGPGLLQIKTGALWKKEEWAEEAPIQYQIQVQHELGVRGYAWGSLAVLLGGQHFLWLDFERNEHFLELLIEREAAFWKLVKTGTPPPMDGSPSAKELLAKLYPKPEPGKVVELPIEAATWDQNLVAIKEQLKAMDAEKSLLENKIKAAIGEAEVGVLPSGDSYKWSFVHKEVPAKPAHTEEYRMLRRNARKDKR